MFEIGKGPCTGPEGAGEQGWLLAPAVARGAMPGTVFAIDRSGRTRVVGLLDVKLGGLQRLDMVPLRASADACRRFLGLDRAASGAETEDVTLELPDSEAETLDDDDLQAHLTELIEKVRAIYRADQRYFVVRGALTAPSVVFRQAGEPRGAGAQARGGVATSRVGTLSFERPLPVGVLLDEIRTTRSNLGGGPPTLGLMRLEQPPGWAEDATVPWVTSILAPAATARTREFAVRQAVDLRTSIGIPGEAGELASIGISPEMLENATIQFKVTVEGAWVRPSDAEHTPVPAGSSNSTGTGTIVSPALHFLPEAPALFLFILEAEVPGRVALHVTLYLNGRPTLRQDIALAAVAASAAAPEPTSAPASAAAGSTAVATPIDGRHLMTLPSPRIALEFGDHDDDYPIELTVDGRRSPERVTPATHRADLALRTIEWRRRLVALSEQYGQAGVDELAAGVPDALRAFAQIGVEMHRALFGRPAARGIESLRRMADSIAQVSGDGGRRPLMMIAAERLPLPWGLVHDRPLPADGPVDPAGFWGQRFLIERIAPAVLGKVPGRSLRGAGEVGAQLVACVNGHLDAQQHVEAAAHQRDFFLHLAAGGLASRPLVTSRDEFQQWLVADQGESRLVYLFCHAHSAHTLDERYFQSRDASDVGTWLDLDADERQRIDIGWLADKRAAPLTGQPLVFLNACSTAEGDREFQSPFLTQFIREYDARGLIGSDWKVPTVFADAFSRRFLRRFLRVPGDSLGRAFAATADEFMAAGNPFPLIYAIYGRSDLVVAEETST